MVYKISSDLISVLSGMHAILQVRKPKHGEDGLNTTAREERVGGVEPGLDCISFDFPPI